jgi:hypothetical protein
MFGMKKVLNFGTEIGFTADFQNGKGKNEECLIAGMHKCVNIWWQID